MRILSSFLMLAFAGCAWQPRLRPFTTDGCTLFPDGSSEHEDLWLDCCKRHDYAYWMGGTKSERLNADLALRECVALVGRPKVAQWMLRGSRAGGTPHLPTRFRWGYGWPYPRGYKRLTVREKTLVGDSQPR